MDIAHEPTRNRPLSDAVVDPLPLALWPIRATRSGRFVEVEPLDARQHAGELFEAGHGTPESRRIWDYLPYGPFESLEAFTSWLRGCSAGADPLFFAIRDRETDLASGMASFLNVVPFNGTIEVGHIWFGPDLQNTPAATEALFLMMTHALDELGNRRLEWKCDALNRASRRAAVRLGFAFEGIFYQHCVVKGRNRDTAWFSILDDEWPAIRENFLRWLAPVNFDAEGRQRTSLSAANVALRRR